MTRTVGVSRAMEMVLLAKRLTAQEALTWGILNHVSAPGQLLKDALIWANKISEAGPIAIQQAKKAIQRGKENLGKRPYNGKWSVISPVFIPRID